MFKNQKLDYPNATTDKASKKFLKGLKNLDVSPDPSRAVPIPHFLPLKLTCPPPHSK